MPARHPSHILHVFCSKITKGLGIAYICLNCASLFYGATWLSKHCPDGSWILLDVALLLKKKLNRVCWDICILIIELRLIWPTWFWSTLEKRLWPLPPQTQADQIWQAGRSYQVTLSRKWRFPLLYTSGKGRLVPFLMKMLSALSRCKPGWSIFTENQVRALCQW